MMGKSWNLFRRRWSDFITYWTVVVVWPFCGIVIVMSDFGDERRSLATWLIAFVIGGFILHINAANASFRRIFTDPESGLPEKVLVMYVPMMVLMFSSFFGALLVARVL